MTLRRREQKSGRLSLVGTRSGKGEGTSSAALDVGEFEDGNAIVRPDGIEELVDLAAECLDGFAQFPGASWGFSSMALIARSVYVHSNR